MAIKIDGNVAIDNSRVLPDVGNMTGTFGAFFPNVTSLASASTISVSTGDPCMTLTLGQSATLDAVGTKLTGQTSTLLLDTSASAYTPTFNSDFTFSPSEPTWADHRYWVISLFCKGASTGDIVVFANGYDA
jgi:hypothetical protein